MSTASDFQLKTIEFSTRMLVLKDGKGKLYLEFSPFFREVMQLNQTQTIKLEEKVNNNGFFANGLITVNIEDVDTSFFEFDYILLLLGQKYLHSQKEELIANVIEFILNKKDLLYKLFI